MDKSQHTIAPAEQERETVDKTLSKGTITLPFALPTQFKMYTTEGPWGMGADIYFFGTFCWFFIDPVTPIDNRSQDFSGQPWRKNFPEFS